MNTSEFTSLIQPSDLELLLGDDAVRLVDCRFSLGDVEAGQRAYAEAHIPGAVYAHLDRDLSGTVIPGKTGRHPLPDIGDLAGYLGSIGIDSDVAVVAYDDSGGAFAARLWWLLKWMGHDEAAVLDGGWSRWRDEGRATVSGKATYEARTFTPNVKSDIVADALEVARLVREGGVSLIDARSSERYAGAVEPIDPVAGHIPGAVNCPYAVSLSGDGRFLRGDELRRVLAPYVSDESVVYCGSGVTAAHLVLASVHAGLPMPRLYPGSWSEWITDPERPVERG